MLNKNLLLTSLSWGMAFWFLILPPLPCVPARTYCTHSAGVPESSYRRFTNYRLEVIHPPLKNVPSHILHVGVPFQRWITFLFVNRLSESMHSHPWPLPATFMVHAHLGSVGSSVPLHCLPPFRMPVHVSHPIVHPCDHLRARRRLSHTQRVLIRAGSAASAPAANEEPPVAHWHGARAPPSVTALSMRTGSLLARRARLVLTKLVRVAPAREPAGKGSLQMSTHQRQGWPPD